MPIIKIKKSYNILDFIYITPDQKERIKNFMSKIEIKNIKENKSSNK